MMTIIDKPAEMALLKRIDNGDHVLSGWHVIHIHASSLEKTQRDMMHDPRIMMRIQRMMAQSEGEIYLCQNADMWIILDRISQQEYTRIIDDLARLVGMHVQQLSHIWDWNNQKEDIKLLASFWKNPKEKDQPKKKNLSKAPIFTDILETIQERRKSRKELSILIVEDDTFSRKLVHKCLKKKYHVTEAEDGISAIKSYHTYAPNIVFLDIELPDTHGLKVLKEYLELDSEAYVIMLSAHGHKKNVMGAIDRGAKGFVAKPFSRDKLEYYISEYKAKHQQKKYVE